MNSRDREHDTRHQKGELARRHRRKDQGCDRSSSTRQSIFGVRTTYGSFLLSWKQVLPFFYFTSIAPFNDILPVSYKLTQPSLRLLL